MPSRQLNLQEDTNFRVLRLLQDNPNISQRRLADTLGIAAKAALTGRFLKRKMAEYELLKAEIESLLPDAAATRNQVKPNP